MHDETVSEVISQGSGLVASLLKEVFVHRQNMDQMEQRKAMEIELERTRQQATESTGADTDAQTARPQVDTPDVAQADVSNALDELIDQEMCSVCRDLLKALKHRPVDEQVQGIMEYGKFKRDLEDGATVDDLKASLRKTTVLQDVFQEKFTAAAPDG